MTTRITFAFACGLALSAGVLPACRSGSPTPSAPVAAQTPAAEPSAQVAWSRPKATERIHQLSESLHLGTARFEDVLDFAVEALAGLDTAGRKVGVDGSVTLGIRADDGVLVGSLRVRPVSAAGVRPIQLSFETAPQHRITDFDAAARAKLELELGLGLSSLDYCDATSKSEFRASMPFLQSITELKPLPVGGTLLVDPQGVCTWQGTQIQFVEKTPNEPHWQTSEQKPEPRAVAAIEDARIRALKQRIASVGKP